MSNVYVIQDDGKTVPMNRVRCRDEERELQMLLESNPQLMPGDQISPDDPRRWLLIKREMPVPDPSSGEDRWSIDHFFVDQSGIPTFVECKRYLDTRSRREVVGQMLDYAANGHWYWDHDVIKNYALQTAKKQGCELEDALMRLAPDNEGSLDEFFEQVVNNLREGQVRMVFFMEEAPHELKSIVDFLNKQMERSEVLIVEAKQFSAGNMKVIAPSLFGYTEEARRVKKKVTVTSGGPRKKWSETTFYEDAKHHLKPEQVEAIRKIHDLSKANAITCRWGGGREKGSINFVAEHICQRSFFSVSSWGYLAFHFGYITGSPEADNFRMAMVKTLQEQVGFAFKDDIDGKYPGFKISEWEMKVIPMVDAMNKLLVSYSQENGDL